MFFRHRLACALALLVATPWAASAQVDPGTEVPDVTRTYALIGAQVVQAPGRVLDSATVIIRDGLITAVGIGVSVPYDAERIVADSLIVYAGFIDGLSHAGIPAPKKTEQPESPGNPGIQPDADAGILPGRDARTLLKANDKSVTDLRKAGFTAAHVVPRGRMLPGTGAIILLTDDDDANKLVYAGESSLFAQLSPASGMYPGSDMAVIAAFRQLLRESTRRQRIEQLYADDPSGIARPVYDPVHHALFPVVDGDRTVFFHTEDALDVHRVLTLQEELGFSVVLTGLNQSFDVMDRLKAAGFPLLLTLDLPEDKRKKKRDAKAEAEPTDAEPTDAAKPLPEAPPTTYDPQLRVSDYNDVEAEKKNLEARRDAVRKKYLETAGMMADADIGFGFTTLGTKSSDVLPNLRTLVENGLSEDAALAALTTNPASILGVSAAMGTIEAGKMGNLVVTTGGIFDKDSEIRYVFIDGRKYKMEPRKSGAGDEPVVVAGTWSLTATTPDGEAGGTIEIDDDLTGTITIDMFRVTVDLLDVSLDQNELSLSFTVEGMGTFSATVTIEGDTFSGEASSEMTGSFPVTGSRITTPE